MGAFVWTLRILGPGFVLAGSIHLIFGVAGESLLGAQLSAASVVDPVLDSQNRFYGTAFTLYGFLLLLCTQDLARYAPVLKLALWVFFAAGVSRVLAVWFTGWPGTLVEILLAIELVLPLLLLAWLRKLEPLANRAPHT